jgi:alpha-glucosidase
MEEVLAYLREVVDGFADRVLVAEIGLPPSRAARYHKAIDIPLNFGLITEPWTAERLERRIRAYLEALPEGAWPNWVLGNHDVSRVATPTRRRARARGGRDPDDAPRHPDAVLRR